VEQRYTPNIIPKNAAKKISRFRYLFVYFGIPERFSIRTRVFVLRQMGLSFKKSGMSIQQRKEFSPKRHRFHITMPRLVHNRKNRSAPYPETRMVR
jgi:hypothetical protein